MWPSVTTVIGTRVMIIITNLCHDSLLLVVPLYTSTQHLIQGQPARRINSYCILSKILIFGTPLHKWARGFLNIIKFHSNCSIFWQHAILFERDSLYKLVNERERWGQCCSKLYVAIAHRLLSIVVVKCRAPEISLRKYQPTASWKATKAQRWTWPANLRTLPWPWESTEQQRWAECDKACILATKRQWGIKGCWE